MMNPISITENDKMLIVAPHPDDECIGAGGVLTRFASQCSVIVLSDGALGQGELSGEEYRRIRKQEFFDEMNSLGVRNYRMLDLPDGELMQYTDCLHEVSIEDYSKIFVTGNHDLHSDHIAAYEAVRSAALFRNLKETEVYMYEVHNYLSFPTHYLDISDCMENKINLIKNHASQFGKVPYDQLVLANARVRAFQNRMFESFVEVYELADIENTDLNPTNCEEIKELQKFRLFYGVLTKWMLKGNVDSVSQILNKSHIGTCAIYGFAELGKILYRQLRESDVRVLYVLDKKVKDTGETALDVYCPGRNLPKPDAVIVTAVLHFEEIRKELESLGYSNVMSIKDIIDKID